MPLDNDPQPPTSTQQPSITPENLDQQLLQRIQASEQHKRDIDMDEDEDSFERPQSMNLHPSDAPIDAFPQIQEDFFRSRLDDVSRRRYLAEYLHQHCTSV